VQRSWTVSLWCPSESGGGKVAGSVFTAITGGLAGRTIYHHYAGVWAANGNDAVSHAHAYKNAPHQAETGCHSANKSGNSTAYWASWDRAVVELRDD